MAIKDGITKSKTGSPFDGPTAVSAVDMTGNYQATKPPYQIENSRLNSRLNNRFGHTAYYDSIKDFTPNMLAWYSADKSCYTDAACQFTATDKECLQIAHSTQTGLDASTRDFSFAFWMWCDTLPTQYAIIQKGASSSGAGSPGYLVRVLANGSITTRFSDGSGASINATSAAGVLTTKAWYFVTVTISRTGNLVISVGSATVAPTSVASADVSGQQGAATAAVTFYLGSLNATDGYYFDGRIDSLGIWAKALSDAEITYLYNSGKGHIYTDLSDASAPATIKMALISWWDLGEPTGIRYDSHGTNHLSQVFGNIIQPPVYGAELFATNTSFEAFTGTPDDGVTDSFTGWDTFNTDASNIAEATTTAHSGTYAVKCTSTNKLPGVCRTASVTPGAKYRISGWARGDGAGHSGRVGVYNNTNPSYIYSTDTGITGTTYDFFTVDFTAPAGCLSVTLQFYNAVGGTVYWDDLSIKQITTAAIGNGGFEDLGAGGADVFANWSEEVVPSSTITNDPTGAYNGTGSLKLTIDSNGSMVDVYQRATKTVGKLYKASFYAKADSVASNPVVSVETYPAGTTSSKVVLTSTSYTLYNTYIRSGGDTIIIGSRGAGSPNINRTIWIDNLTVQAAEILSAPGIAASYSSDANFAAQFKNNGQYFTGDRTCLNPGPGDFSIGLAFYADDVPSNRTACLMGKGATGSTAVNSCGYYIGISTGGFAIRFADDGSSTRIAMDTNTPVVAGNFYTAIANFDRDGKITLYVNGNKVDEVDMTGEQGPCNPAGLFSFAIGWGNDGYSPNNYFVGRIDNAFYCNRLLTDKEIAYLHNGGKWRQYAELGQIGTDGANLIPTYSTNLISNGDFQSGTTGWTGTNATLEVAPGGKSGNCLKVTNTAASAGRADISIPTVVGKSYRVTFSHKNGTMTGSLYVGTTQGAYDLATSGSTNDVDWTTRSYTFTAKGTTTWIGLRVFDTTIGTYTYYDDVSIQQVDNIIGFWEFDTGVNISKAFTDGIDSTGNGNNLTSNGSPTQVPGINYIAGTVTRLQDLSANQINFVQTSNVLPEYIDNVVNGKPVTRFNMTNYLMLNDVTPLKLYDKTIFAVIRPRDDTSLQIFLGCGPVTNWWLGVATLCPVCSFADKTPTGQTTYGALKLSNQNFNICTYHWNVVNDNVTVSMWVNGVKDSVVGQYTNGVWSTFGSVFVLGAFNATPSNGFNGDIAEILIMDRTLCEAERKNIEQYLSRKYNIAITP